jgi:hypothetical protein
MNGEDWEFPILTWGEVGPGDVVVPLGTTLQEL